MARSGRAAAIAALGALVVLAGCGQPLPSETSQDLLYLRSPRRVAVVAAGAAAPSFRGTAVPTRDWSSAVRTFPTGRTTVVSSVNPSTGTEHWERELRGNLKVDVVSEAGDLVSLSPVRERHYTWGRSTTRLIIVGSRTEPRTITLEGNYEPEAFSTDGKSLFVISYLPARAPTQYQVRRLDLVTEKVEAVYTPDAHLQRAMGGTARIQAASPDGRRLYTLYTLNSGGSQYAFIHVLSLDELWAHCIDLPPEFAKDVEASTAISVSPDGKHLYVANSRESRVAEVDTSSLAVTRVASIGLGTGRSIHALSAPGDRLYVSTDRLLTAIDTEALADRRYWTMSERISGIQVSADGRKIYVGLGSRIAILDAASGKRLESIDPPGVNRIRQFGPVDTLDTVDEPPSNFTCAC